jgi:cell division protein ZapA
MSDTIAINISLSDRNYRLLVEAGEEEFVRRAGKNIENMIREYSASYAYKDKQDLLAMVALQNTTALVKLQGVTQITDETLNKQLENIDKILELE